jgi:pilus assembly protein Flp/PilA
MHRGAADNERGGIPNTSGKACPRGLTYNETACAANACGEILQKGDAAMFIAVRSRRNQRGQGLVEYALILVLVAVVVIASLMILGPIIGNTFSTINSSISSV